jgi:hypothetical protein
MRKTNIMNREKALSFFKIVGHIVNIDRIIRMSSHKGVFFLISYSFNKFIVLLSQFISLPGGGLEPPRLSLRRGCFPLPEIVLPPRQKT